MVGIEFYDSASQNNVPFAVLTAEFESWANSMKQDGTLKAAMDSLRAKLEFYRSEANKVEVALRALESVDTDNGNGHQTVVMHPKEFAKAGIAEAAVAMIKRANRPLHVSDIAEGLKAGGYVFKTDNPTNSIAPVLYMAAKDKKHDVVSKGKNTYSLGEIEERNRQ